LTDHSHVRKFHRMHEIEALKLQPGTTALVLIDLQQGVVGVPSLTPYTAADVVRNSATLAQRFRALGAPVVLVRVAFSADGADALKPTLDTPAHAGARPANWSELVPELAQAPGDIVITKKQWGAFYGTELELQLRRRRISTLVMGGIATNMGVESTARDAFEHGYEQVFVEDAMTSIVPEGHAFAVQHILPRMGRVRSTQQVLQALAMA
jgi:nicotinamidase-related amidase